MARAIAFMCAVNTMFSASSTTWLLPAENVGAQHKQMVDSQDFSARLDLALEINGLTNREFAELVNKETGQQLVHNWRKRGRIGEASRRQVQKILWKSSMIWLNEGRGSPTDPDFKFVAPKVLESAGDPAAEVPVWSARAAAGATAINEDGRKAGSILFRPRSLENKGINPHEANVFFVDGDSMSPRLKSGDAVLFDTSDKRIRDGKVYVIQWDEDTFVKRLYKELDGSIRITSDNKNNPEYRDRVVPPDAEGFTVLGRVRWVGSWED